MIKVACKSSDSRCLFRQIIEFGMSCNSFLVSLRNKLFIIWENRRSDLTGPFSHSIHDYKISRHSSHGCIRTKIKRQLLAFSKLVSFLLLVSTFFRLSTFNTTFEFYHMIFFIFFFPGWSQNNCFQAVIFNSMPRVGTTEMQGPHCGLTESPLVSSHLLSAEYVSSPIPNYNAERH